MPAGSRHHFPQLLFPPHALSVEFDGDGGEAVYLLMVLVEADVGLEPFEDLLAPRQISESRSTAPRSVSSHS